MKNTNFFLPTLAIVAVLGLIFFLVERSAETFVAGVDSPTTITPYGIPLFRFAWWPPQRRRNMSYDLRGDIPIRPAMYVSPWYQPSVGPIYLHTP